ncbi:MAG: hypothetical protein K8R58_06830 [Bacteroidales bacterium]|nr:hypothetical protein [Bacteroidales bacterium]
MKLSEKRKHKRKRREYIRREKASIRRQKREMKEKFRKRHHKGAKYKILFFFKNIIDFFNSKSQEKEDLTIKKRRSKIRKRNYLRDERRSIRRERRELRIKTRPMRRKIRRARIKEFKKNIISFIKNPFPRKKISREDKRLRRLIKQERLRLARQNIYKYPSRKGQSIKRFWQIRARIIKNLGNEIAEFFNRFTEVFRNKELNNKYFITTVNSLIFFILAFLTVYIINQYTTILAASFFDIPSVLYSYRIYWPLYTYSSLYTRGALIIIFGTGPLLCLILGFVFFRLLLLTRNRINYFKTYFLWVSIHAFNMFFGAYIVGVITRTGFIYTSEWLFLSNVFDVEEIIFLIVSIVALIIIGYISTKHFLALSNSNNMIVPKNRIFYIFSQVFIPWVLGNIVLYSINIPNNPFNLTLLILTTILIIIPVFTNYNSMANQQIKLTKVLERRLNIGWVYLILLIIVLIVFRLGLGKGVSFG